MTGPITAEMPLKKDMVEKAILTYSGFPRALSTAAWGQVDVDPPLYRSMLAKWP